MVIEAFSSYPLSHFSSHPHLLSTPSPPGRSGQQRWHHIGPYGRGSGKWTLKAARDERDRLDQLRKAGDDPRVLKADAKRAVEEKCKVLSLQEVAEDYLRRSKNRQSTVSDYRNMLFNQVLPVLGHKSPVNRFEWNNGGRQKILNLKQGIEARGSLYQSDKCLMVMRSMFEHAIDNAWMQPPNPALGSKGARSKHEPKHHPTLEWEHSCLSSLMTWSGTTRRANSLWSVP